jgi:hypothetical protein
VDDITISVVPIEQIIVPAVIEITLIKVDHVVVTASSIALVCAVASDPAQH